jgi:Protein of unknown function (DUF3891)
MVLRPLLPPPARESGGPPFRPVLAKDGEQAPLSAWDAVERTQKEATDECWLIAQPDHAALAGDIAAHLLPELFPGLDQPVLQAIGLHDEGWGPADTAALKGAKRPASFIAETPTSFVEAWTTSIDRCQQVAPIGGVIVSQHFARLADFRLSSRKDSADDTRLLLGFLTAEDQRRRALLPACSSYDPGFLTDVLQFCDVLSLYLCCGAQESVVFRQRFGGRGVRLERLRTGDQAAICRFSPSILDGTTELAVSGRNWPATREDRQFLFVLE